MRSEAVVSRVAVASIVIASLAFVVGLVALVVAGLDAKVLLQTQHKLNTIEDQVRHLDPKKLLDLAVRARSQ